jgi:hypothetical protein
VHRWPSRLPSDREQRLQLRPLRAPLTHPLRTSTDRGCSWTVTATGPTASSQPKPGGPPPAPGTSEPVPADPHHEEQVGGSAFSPGAGPVSGRGRS